MSIIRPCNPSFSDLFVLAVFFCFVCLFCLILTLSVLPIIPAQTSTLFLECVASVSVRFRIKERRTRARSSDGGDWSVLDSYTGKTRRGGGWPPATSRLTSGADMKLCCFLLFVFLFRFVFFSFAACYCRFFKFCCVFFSCRYHIRIETNSSLFLT